MGNFSGIIADPPWPYANPRALIGNGGRGACDGHAAEIVQADVGQHYSTMTLDEIKDLPVKRIVAPSSLLFLWTTNPFLADGSAPAVVRAWGFSPKSVLTWAKVQADGVTPSMKTGHWLRSASEHLILGVRGHPRRPEGMPAFPTWFSHRRLPHSVKPTWAHSLLEQMIPSGRLLEMFARRGAPSKRWAVWGNEVDSTFSFVDDGEGL